MELKEFEKLGVGEEGKVGSEVLTARRSIGMDGRRLGGKRG